MLQATMMDRRRRDQQKKKEPFSGRPLPQPGESLGDAAMDLLFGRALTSVTTGLAAVIIGMTLVIMRWLGYELSPWPLIVLGSLILAFGLWDFWRMGPKLRNLRLGIRGEREVGRMLEETRALGYHVFHDIPGEGFNVDHALIGPGGVFAIETKTLSKPAKGRAEVHYDGSKVLIDGHAPDRHHPHHRDPIAQARASADHLRDLLKRTTGRDVFVRPVVLYPGWWVNPQPRGVHVWVLNPKNLAGFLRHEPAKLPGEDVALYVDRVTREVSAG